MAGSVKVRRSRRSRSHTRRPPAHLYRAGAEPREIREFERRYEAEGLSKARADRIYGATVGKVKRERAAKRGRK